MSISVWPTPSYAIGPAAVSLLPIIYSNGTATSVNGDVLTILAGEEILAQWGCGSWQRVHIS